MFAVAVLVLIGVVGLLLGGLFRKRAGPPDPREPRGGVAMIVGGGIVLPVVVLTGLLFLILTTAMNVRGGGEGDPLRIEVAGYQWWWSVRYPEQGAVTANEIHIPVGRPIELALTSVDVIHSFWVPELQGKVDMIPGQTNVLHLEASEPGVYRGQCAEFCGIQHANMAFHVIAEEPTAFETWAQTQAEDRVPPEGLAQDGEGVFLSKSCRTCHTVRGTPATGETGPDLTHVMSRRWLAAGTIENSREHMARWIAAPQQIKHGNYMPSVALTDDEMAALLAYLYSLE